MRSIGNIESIFFLPPHDLCCKVIVCLTKRQKNTNLYMSFVNQLARYTHTHLYIFLIIYI
ncbi:hypothetical protein CLU79DRAFT_779667 [Phycomyces nitens]|nr:hypothetical protein CLU79DRAFT_779667 [Phycomyces nitens]